MPHAQIFFCGGHLKNWSLKNSLTYTPGTLVGTYYGRIARQSRSGAFSQAGAVRGGDEVRPRGLVAMSAVLSNIEAARISAILQEATEKLSFLGSITPDVVACRDELLRTVGDEVTRGIGAQRVLERRYEELVTQRSSLKALSNKAKYDENQQHLKEAAHALRESTKQQCQKFKGSPNIGENLSQMQAKRSNLQKVLSITLQELRSNSFETLAEATAEEKARTDKIADAISREEERSSRIHGLREDLISLREVNAQDLEGKTNAIEKLKKELWDERKNSAINLKCARCFLSSCANERDGVWCSLVQLGAVGCSLGYLMAPGVVWGV